MKTSVKLMLMLGLSIFTIACSNESFTEEELNYEALTAEISEETAFANCMSPDHIRCFLDDGINRWGWTNGPVNYGLKSPLIAGAGQCNTEKGTVVGYVDVNYNFTTQMVHVKFEALEGWEITETHLYVGETPYPTNKKGKISVAPGKFPHKGQMEYVVPAPNPFYYIGHAVVVQDMNEE